MSESLTQVKRVAVFYPFEDILERRRGCSQRTGLMVDYLKENFEEVRVFSVNGCTDLQKGNVRYISYYQNRLISLISKVFHCLFQVLVSIITGGYQSHILWWHYKFRFDPSFIRWVKEAVNWAEVVYLEYTFLGSTVIKACKSKGVKVILTDHDVLADQITSSRLKKLVSRAELKALHAATKVVCVSSADQAVFSKLGVDAEFIPHGIDIRQFDNKQPNAFLYEYLEECYKIKLSQKNVCLFIGSHILPNISAVEKIREIARSLSPPLIPDYIYFVIAGDCCPPEKNSNFLSLGKVDAPVLRALYQIADIVLIPLQVGTGASVKTIEAMAWGKPILGTTLGFRGYPIESGVNCVVSDDFLSYPKLITELLDDVDKRHTLGENARKFAEGYDYRRLYKKYIDMVVGC